MNQKTKTDHSVGAPLYLADAMSRDDSLFSKIRALRKDHGADNEDYYCLRMQNFKISSVFGPNHVDIAEGLGLASSDVFLLCRVRQYQSMKKFLQLLAMHTSARSTSNKRVPRLGYMSCNALAIKLGELWPAVFEFCDHADRFAWSFPDGNQICRVPAGIPKSFFGKGI